MGHTTMEKHDEPLRGHTLGVVSPNPNPKFLTISEPKSPDVPSGVLSIAVLPDGSFVSGSDDRTLRVWGPDGTPGPVFRGHQGMVPAVQVTRLPLSLTEPD